MPACRPGAAPVSLLIRYEDDDLIVVEKPAGMVVHPAYRNPDGTMWDALVPVFAARGLGERPRLLHRLDRATSGLICVPKRLDAHRTLERDLRTGRFAKGYLGLAHGSVQDEGTIELPLARDPQDRRIVRTSPNGQSARTRFRTLRRLPGATLLRIQLETGRTHQIRAHLAALGHPLVGDALYGADPSPGPDRLFLHADRLSFPHPRGGAVSVHSPLPYELKLFLYQLQTGRSHLTR